jgi:hypothetical protein
MFIHSRLHEAPPWETMNTCFGDGLRICKGRAVNKDRIVAKKRQIQTFDSRKILNTALVIQNIEGPALESSRAKLSTTTSGVRT